MNARLAWIHCAVALLFATAAAAEMPPAEETPLSESGAHIYAHNPTIRPAGPLQLEPGPHLFIDDFYVGSAENVRRVVVSPRRDESIPNPVITGKEDGCFQPYMSILREPGRFRIWYGRRTEDMNGMRSHIGYAESPDGIHWNRPTQTLADPGGAIQFGVSVLDTGDPARRYIYAWHLDSRFHLASSPDGLNWTPFPDPPVLRHNHDICGLCYDPARKQYVATLSVYRPGDKWTGDRRITMHSRSTDLQNWSTPRHVLLPDDSIDSGQTQFYAMDGYLARGGLLIGMVKVLRDDLKADDPPEPDDAYGMGYTALAWTRDGATWYRDTAHFLDPDPRRGAWDHAHAWIDEQVPVDDEVYLYYGGYARGHKVNRFEERQIGLVKMKRDRYAGWEATGEGRIVTPPVTLNAQTLTLNADVSKGSIDVRILNEEGQPIDGFERSAPITVDAVAAPVSWPKPLSDLQGQTVRIEFRLRGARLFAFDLG